MVNFLHSARTHELSAELIVYDLGMTESEIEEIERRFSLTVQRFDYSSYPDFMNVKVAAGQYAWKPQILKEASSGRSGVLCWMDAGNLIERPLKGLVREANRAGYYSPYSSGTVRDWTHPKMLAYFGLPGDWMATARNLNGACVAFDLDSALGVQLLDSWASAAQVEVCIAPQGSNRTNHRQDQALLTVLAYRAGRPVNAAASARKLLGFSIHNDVERIATETS